MQETAGGAPEEIAQSAFENSPNERDIDTLEMSLRIAAPPDRVFALLTDPDRDRACGSRRSLELSRIRAAP